MAKITTASMDGITFLVERWSTDRGLDKAENSTKQALKLFEEAGELAQAHLKQKDLDAKDAIGDIMVVLAIYCQQRGWSLAECYEQAWEEIRDRKGKMVDGSYIKEGDL